MSEVEVWTPPAPIERSFLDGLIRLDFVSPTSIRFRIRAVDCDFAGTVSISERASVDFQDILDKIEFCYLEYNVRMKDEYSIRVH